MLDERLSGTGMIKAVLEDGTVYHFKYEVENDEFIFIEREQVLKFVRLKPNPLIATMERRDFLKQRKEQPLVMEYHIDPEVVAKLVDNGRIMYSAFCADLYNLPRNHAYDIQDHKRDYKWSKNKEKVLAHARNGQFN